MKYSIVLPYYDPAYKKTQMFTYLIESIVKCSDGKDYELVIVKDGNSYVESHNIGLKNAKGDYIVVMNDDMLVQDEKWLEKLTSDTAIVSWDKKDHEGVVIPGATCFAMSRTIFEKLGLMDEAFKYGVNFEDTDYFMRAHSFGIPFLFPEIALKHYGGRTIEQNYRHENHDDLVDINRQIFKKKWPNEK